MGLIDADQYRSAEVLATMDALGTRHLKWISVSNYDADHVGAIVDVATASGVSVGAVYDRGGGRNAKDSATYRNYYDWVIGAGLRHPVDIGDTFTLCSGADQVAFHVVSAGTDGTAAGGVAVSEENDRGVCLHVEYGDFDLATCGDVDGTDEGSRTDVESQVAPAMGDVEVVKVDHHGSAYSSNLTYVNTLSAEVAVISVGKNSYGHPDPAVVARWDQHGDVFQTQDPDTNALVDGNVVVVTDGTSLFDAMGSASGRSVAHHLDEASG